MSSAGAERPAFRTSSGPGLNDPPPFIDTARALTICARELESLADEIARLVKEIDVEPEATKPEVRRAPNRCIVQLGPIALTVSWLRGHSETVSAGRLLVIEWTGVVGRAAERTPERSLGVSEREPAAILRESVFRASATNADDWRWKGESQAKDGLSSLELAASCIGMLRGRYEQITA